jgi:hypothetical protein
MGRGGEEVLVRLAGSPSDVENATHVRGSMLCASLQALRKRGLGDRYLEVLAPEHRETMLGMTAATWAPIDVCVAHYHACDRLSLPPSTIEEIGAESGAFLQSSVVSVLLKGVKELGATPWAVISKIDKLRDRLWRGSAWAVHRLGPKEARLEWHGQPCASSPYYCLAFGAFAGATIQPFARMVVTRQLVELSSPTVLVYRLSWV